MAEYAILPDDLTPGSPFRTGYCELRYLGGLGDSFSAVDPDSKIGAIRIPAGEREAVDEDFAIELIAQFPGHFEITHPNVQLVAR